MKWYSAKGLFKSEVENAGLSSRSIEESIITISSDTLENAMQKAEDFFIEYEEKYINIYNQHVNRCYMDMCNIHEISVLMENFNATDGEEVYSSIVFVPNLLSDNEFKKMHFRNYNDETKKYYFNSDVFGFDYDSKRYEKRGEPHSDNQS